MYGEDGPAGDFLADYWYYAEGPDEPPDFGIDDGSYDGDYCEHGTYIGTPGGADFMCAYCEGR